jgi:hypothetical protein
MSLKAFNNFLVACIILAESSAIEPVLENFKVICHNSDFEELETIPR